MAALRSPEFERSVSSATPLGTVLPHTGDWNVDRSLRSSSPQKPTKQKLRALGWTEGCPCASIGDFFLRMRVREGRSPVGGGRFAKCPLPSSFARRRRTGWRLRNLSASNCGALMPTRVGKKACLRVMAGAKVVLVRGVGPLDRIAPGSHARPG